MGELCIQTYTGRRMDLATPDPATVCIEDIAHALSQLCRFAGHTRRFYSVAQHSVLVSVYLANIPRSAAEVTLALWGLLHDAAEAYVVDVPRPLKQAAGMEPYREIEERVQAAILVAFSLPLTPLPEVDLMDRRMLVTERRDLLIHTRDVWAIQEPALPGRIVPMLPNEAKSSFLARFTDLMEWRSRFDREMAAGA